MAERKPLTRPQLLERLNLLEPVDKAQRNSLTCVLIGHSAIVGSCMGQITCARCDAVIGDTLMGSMSLKDNVVLGHGCPDCRKNFSKLGWRDKLYTPTDPFKVKP